MRITKRKNNSYCTNKQLGILKQMYLKEMTEEYEEAEIVCEGTECWIGFERTSWRLVNDLLRLCLIKDDSDQGKGCYRFCLNDDGRSMVEDPTHVPLIVQELGKINATSSI